MRVPDERTQVLYFLLDEELHRVDRVLAVLKGRVERLQVDGRTDSWR